MRKEFIVYDIETYMHCFILVAYNINTNVIYVFEISKRKNELNVIKNFIKTNSNNYFVGYNNIEFDYPIVHWMLSHETIESHDIYYKAQDIIEAEVKWHIVIPEYKQKCKQIDLYKIHHFDNAAKRTSLKALEIAMKMSNVKDLPYDIGQPLTNDQIEELIAYCKHDVKATTMFFFKSKNEIQLRFDLSKEYGLNLINHNDPKMGEGIFMKYLSKSTGKPRKHFVENNTRRKYVDLDECILDYIKFDTKQFQLLNDWLKRQRVYYTKGFFTRLKHENVKELLPYMNKKLEKGLIKNLNVIHNGFQYDIGTGGLHGCIKAGVHVETEEECIIDYDVSSYYPNLAIVNKFYPEHLNETFCDIYKMIYEMRKAIPKSDSRNGGLKLALNGTFGKAGEENSPFFDNKFLLSITLNGQLLLLKYVEMLTKVVPDVLILQVNTDGVTFKCNRKYIDIVDKISKEWETHTNLELERAFYKKMVINNVNNYQSEYTNGDVKLKGLFEVNKAWHKDHSMIIVPIALKKYFIDGISIEETIRNHDNIYDFCLRQKFNKGFQGELHSVNGSDILIEPTQKNTRYIISKTGKYFWKKKLETGKLSTINERMKVIDSNNIDETTSISDYNINYDWYIKEARKILNIIEDKQLTLF